MQKNFSLLLIASSLIFLVLFAGCSTQNDPSKKTIKVEIVGADGTEVTGNITAETPSTAGFIQRGFTLTSPDSFTIQGGVSTYQLFLEGWDDDTMKLNLYVDDELLDPEKGGRNHIYSEKELKPNLTTVFMITKVNPEK